jgi:hypothetical protein
MTFQTKKTLLVPNQHLRIYRSMRLMTTHAALQPHGWVLKGERTPFVRMALDASGLVTEGDSYLPGLQPAVRLVTVNATDRSFMKAMAIGLGKSPMDLVVTAETEQVGLVRQQVH